MSHGLGEAEKNFEQSDRVTDGNEEVGQTADKRSIKNCYQGDDKSQNYGVITGDKRNIEDKIKWTWLWLRFWG